MHLPLLLLFRLQSPAQADAGSASFVAAQHWIGTPYQWGGRGTAKNPGLDCLGLMFRGVAAATGASWTRFPVDPSKIVASGALGQPVPGLAGVLRGEVDVDLLHPGDALYFLLADYEIRDAPLWVSADVRYWPWHTALYADAGDVLHAAPGGVVRRQPLAEIAWDALYVTRL